MTTRLGPAARNCSAALRASSSGERATAHGGDRQARRDEQRLGVGTPGASSVRGPAPWSPCVAGEGQPAKGAAGRQDTLAGARMRTRAAPRRVVVAAQHGPDPRFQKTLDGHATRPGAHTPRPTRIERMTATLRTVRQGFGETSRRDAWWFSPGVVAVGFGAFIAYSLFWPSSGTPSSASTTRPTATSRRSSRRSSARPCCPSGSRRPS